MPYRVVQFEETPNPNAVKCWLDRPISEGMRSFRDAQAAREDPVAAALFERAGLTSVLFNGEWMTVNKRPEAKWATVKAAVKRVLAGEGE